MRKCFIFLLALLLLLAALLHCGASPAPVILDDADFLTDSEEASLASSECNCSFAGLRAYLLTLENESAPTDGRVKSKCGIGNEDDALVLVVRTRGGTYYYDMYTFGAAYDVFSDDDVDEILDDPDVYTALKSGKVYDGYRSFLSACHPFTAAYERDLADAAARRAARAENAALTSVLLGLVLGVLAGGITVLCVFLSYRRKRHGESYPLDRYAKLALTDSSDVFIGSYVTRVRVQSNNSSSSRGGHRGGR